MDKKNSSLNQQIIVGRIKKLLQEKGATELDLTEYLGIHPDTVKNWKKNRSDSYLHYLKEISEYLNVTPNYLILGENGLLIKNGEEIFTNDELAIINLYRKMKCDEKYYVSEIMKMIVKHSEEAS